MFSKLVPRMKTLPPATAGLFERLSTVSPAEPAGPCAPAVSVENSGPTMILAPSAIACCAAAAPPAVVPADG